MATRPTNPLIALRSSLMSWLDAPLPGWCCALGWCVATALFIGVVALFGGPSHTDTQESVYGTWAIAHGDTACAYPGVTFEGYPVIAPLYLLASGAIAAVTRIGHTVAFPSAAALGPGCDKAFVAMNRWSVHAGALGPTAWIGCAAWLVLMFGVVAWLRASGRGRRGWEPVTLVVVACLPPVWMCVELAFHPQDLMALGFALAALACARRDRWIGAGFLVALAVLSQQYALLVAAPLLVLAPPTRRIRYAAAALVTAAIVDIPLLIVTSTGHALRAITLGTGDNASIGGTMLWELHLHGASVVLLSRVAPIAVAMALAWWVSRRHGPAALQPVLLMSVVAVSLGLRLVFEQNIFAYYFMALAVCVVLLDVAGTFAAQRSHGCPRACWCSASSEACPSCPSVWAAMSALSAHSSSSFPPSRSCSCRRGRSAALGTSCPGSVSPSARCSRGRAMLPRTASSPSRGSGRWSWSSPESCWPPLRFSPTCAPDPLFPVLRTP